MNLIKSAVVVALAVPIITAPPPIFTPPPPIVIQNSRPNHIVWAYWKEVLNVREEDEMLPVELLVRGII